MKRANQVWRRRRCEKCGSVFSTLEGAQHELAWAVRSSPGGGTLEPFSRDKLFLSLHRSLAHRKTATHDAGALTGTVISKLTGLAHDGVVNAQTVTRTAQVVLNRFDKAASVHYQAFHQLHQS